MLAQSSPPFDSDAHLFEVKWDGTRCLAFIGADRLRLVNRREIEMRGRYPEFECLLRLPPGTVLDGEVIVLDGGKPSFPRLQQREHLQDATKIALVARRVPATYMAFDLVWLAGESQMSLPLVTRREKLSAIIKGLNNPHIIAADYIVGAGVRYFEAAERAGLEGIMAKRLDSRYTPGKRSSAWLKIKVAQTEPFEIIGFEQRDGEPTLKSIIVGERHGRKWSYKANVGSGFTDEQRQVLHDHLLPMPELENPPSDGPKGALWRKTGLRCLVRYFEKTGIGKLRAPVFRGMLESDVALPEAPPAE